MAAESPFQSSAAGDETAGDDRAVLVERVRRALAEDPVVGQLDVEVTLRGRQAMLTGYVVTDERRDRITDVVSELLPGYSVHNATTTGAYPGPGDQSEELPS